MKIYDEGMSQVVRFFERCQKAGTPEPVLDELSQWLESILPHYLKQKRDKKTGRERVYMNTERLIPALKARVKQLGHDFAEGAKLATLEPLHV